MSNTEKDRILQRKREDEKDIQHITRNLIRDGYREAALTVLLNQEINYL
ncbi:MAG: hypothetical protein WCI57_04260 [Candidatus Berkelbacteria bacterium]